MVSLSSNASINHTPHPALFYQNMTLKGFYVHCSIAHSDFLKDADKKKPKQPFLVLDLMDAGSKSTQRHMCVPLGIGGVNSRAFQWYMTCLNEATSIGVYLQCSFPGVPVGCMISVEGVSPQVFFRKKGKWAPPTRFLSAIQLSSFTNFGYPYMSEIGKKAALLPSIMKLCPFFFASESVVFIFSIINSCKLAIVTFSVSMAVLIFLRQLS